MDRDMHFAQDRLVRRLMDGPEVGQMVVANPYRSGLRKLARRVRGRERPLPAGARATLFSPTSRRWADPPDIPALERRYSAYGNALQRHAFEAGITAPSVITAHPLIAGFVDFSWARSVTFYATDDWTAHPDYEALWPAFVESFDRFRDTGHRLCAVSDEIVRRIKPTGPALVVPNGIEPREWTPLPRPPTWVREFPRPLLLYLGTLDSRLSIEHIRAAAQRFAHGTVLLMGPVTDRTHLESLSSLGNVRVHEPVGARTSPRSSPAPTRASFPTAHTTDHGDEPAQAVRVPRGRPSGRGGRPSPDPIRHLGEVVHR